MYISDMGIPYWLLSEADDQKRVDLARNRMRLALKQAAAARAALKEANKKVRQSIDALVLSQLPLDLLQKHQESCEIIEETCRHAFWKSFTHADLEDVSTWMPHAALDKDLPTFPHRADT